MYKIIIISPCTLSYLQTTLKQLLLDMARDLLIDTRRANLIESNRLDTQLVTLLSDKLFSHIGAILLKMLFISLVLLAAAVYLYLWYVYSYWSRNGFPTLEPSIPVGNLNRLVKREKSFGETLFELYRQSTEPFVGIYMLFRPTLLVRDAALTHQMLTTDFASFHDRGTYCNPKYDPLSENIFAMNGIRWKTMRAKLSPTFSTGKLKSMLPTLMTEGDRLVNYMENFAENKEMVEVKDLMSR